MNAEGFTRKIDIAASPAEVFRALTEEVDTIEFVSMDHLQQRPVSSSSWTGRRLMAALVIAFGIYTFFLPLVILKTPTLGRTEWSAFNMSLEVHNRRLPADRHWIELPAVEDALVYLLLMTALVALGFRRGHRLLYHVSTVAMIISLLAMRNATRHFSEFLTGSSHIYWNGGASFGPAMYLLPMTMLALFLLSRRIKRGGD